MQQFLLPRAPLRRGTLLCCHFLIQLGLLTATLLWLLPLTPWLADTSWQAAWPTLLPGSAAWFLAMLLTRLILELGLLPYHLARSQRQGLAAGDMITRSYERRPAVHDEQRAWTSRTSAFAMDEEAVGSARVTQSASRPRGAAVTNDDTPG